MAVFGTGFADSLATAGFSVTSDAKSKRKGIFAAIGAPSLVAGANESALAAASAASSKSAPPEVATTAWVTSPWASTVSMTTTAARSPVVRFASG
jgi:hypothetical protein